MSLEASLDDFLNFTLPELGNWVYWIVFLITFLETSAFVGLVVPGEVTLLIAGILGALAVLTRGADLLVLVPLVIMYFQEREWNWRRTGWDFFYFLFIPLGLLVWMLYLDIRFGDPWLFSEAQSNWLREFAWPLGPVEGLWQGIRSAVESVGTILRTGDRAFWPVTDRDPRLWATYDVLNLGFTLSFLALAVASFWRLPKAYAAYALGAVVLPLNFPSTYVPLLSMPRFALTAFPVFILLAMWGERRRWVDLLVTVMSLVFLGFFNREIRGVDLGGLK